jgi:FMN reductase [NAD(P)H]
MNHIKKPRVPFDSFKHNESYDAKAVDASIKVYDEQMDKYLKDVGRSEQETNWSTFTSRIYQSVYYPKVKDTITKQGLKFK